MRAGNGLGREVFADPTPWIEHSRSRDTGSEHPRNRTMATTYILICDDNRYYIGSTQDFSKRFHEHLAGRCKFTKSRLPVKPVLTEEYESISLARKREYQIKRFKSRSAIEKLVKLHNLARSSNG